MSVELKYPEVPEEINRVSAKIIGCAIEVHRHLGPSFMERTYERALGVELRRQGLSFRSQVRYPIRYKGEVVDLYKPDLVIAERVVVEVKSVDRLDPVFQSQVLSYLKVTGIHLGLLINFNGYSLVEGIRRLVFASPLPGNPD